MKMEFTIADETERDAIFLAYYNHFVLMYGEGYGKMATRKAILAKNYDSKVGAFLDIAYEKACEVVNTFLPNSAIIKISEGGVTRGFFRIMFMETMSEVSAHIGEVVIPDAYLYTNRTDNLSDLIKAIEEEIRSSAPDISKLSYEAVPMDEATCTALEENGYYHHPIGTDSRFYTIIFSKKLLEEKVTRE